MGGSVPLRKLKGRGDPMTGKGKPNEKGAAVYIEIKDEKIRGFVATYRKACSGGITFDWKAQGGIGIVTDISSIRRPGKEVTGLLTKKLGRHTVAITSHIAQMQNKIQSKSVADAALELIQFISERNPRSKDPKKPGDFYQKIFEDYNTIETVPEMAEFLRNELIPITVAIWNQEIGSAFDESLSPNALGVEAAAVKKALGEVQEILRRVNGISLEEEHLEALVNTYMDLVDWSPNEAYMEVDNIIEALKKGEKVNHIDALIFIMERAIDDIISNIESCQVQFNREDIAKKLIKTILIQKGWFEYYGNLSPEQREGEGFPQELTFNIESLNTLVDHIFYKIKELNPLLLDEAPLLPDEAPSITQDDRVLICKYLQ